MTGTAIGTPGVTGAAAMMERDRASAAAGLQVRDLADGAADVVMAVRPDMANGHGITHGGYVFLLADTAFACACNDDRGITVAAGADITFLAPSRPGDTLLARARRRSERGRSGVYDVTVVRVGDAGEEVIAEFRGRSRTVPVDGAAPSAPAVPTVPTAPTAPTAPTEEGR